MFSTDMQSVFTVWYVTLSTEMIDLIRTDFGKWWVPKFGSFQREHIACTQFSWVSNLISSSFDKVQIYEKFKHYLCSAYLIWMYSEKIIWSGLSCKWYLCLVSFDLRNLDCWWLFDSIGKHKIPNTLRFSHIKFIKYELLRFNERTLTRNLDNNEALIFSW